MLKHYYRFVYWRRRLTRAGRTPVRRGPAGRTRAGGIRAARVRGRGLLRTDRIRPLVVFAVIVLIAITASYALGLRDPYGPGAW